MYPQDPSMMSQNPLLAAAGSADPSAQQPPAQPEPPPIVPPPKARRREQEIETAQPEGGFDPPTARIPKENRNAIGYDLMEQVQQAQSDRSAHLINLDYYEQLYEMHVEPRNGPSPQASNVFIPMVPEIVDTMAARLASLIFQPRFFVVNGNTDTACEVQAIVERYMNAEMVRNGWVDPLYVWLQQSLLYGNGILGVFWKRRTVSRKKLVYQPKIDKESGIQVLDLETNEPVFEKKLILDTVVEYDDVDLVTIPLKEFLVFPVWAKSIDDALAVARKVRLDEATLNAMVEAGTLWDDEVEYCLNYHPEGIDERAQDPEGVTPIDADEQLNISEGSVNQSPYRRQRGPLEVWQVHSRQYDMDNDGIFEENIFWVHEQSMRCLGYEPYKYWHGHRPYVNLAGIPRDQIFYAFAVPERLKTLQAELNTKENQKNDAIDRAISPTLVHSTGARCVTGDNKIGPDAEWEVDGPGPVGDAIQYLVPPEVPLSTWQEQQWLYERGMSMMGLNSPMMGAQSSGRRTAREIQAQMSSAGVRLDLIANRARAAMKEVAYQIVQLKIQYGPEQQEVTMQQNGVPTKLILPKRFLAEDLNFDVAGAGGPLDRSSRAQDMMILYTILLRNPLIANNMVRVWNVTQMMLEEHNRPDVQALIGTQEDAQQQQQQMQQMQQMQMMMAMQQGKAGQQQGRQRQGQGPQASGQQVF